MPRTADWFANLSKKAQAEYIKAHPNSKYAKGSKSKAAKVDKTSVAARVEEAAKKHTATANALIKKAKEKMEAAKTPATKAKWKAEVARLTAVKKALKEHGAKGKGISVTYKAGTIESVSGPSRSTSTRRKLSDIAAKAKAHEAKRAADKKKVVAKTPSAKKTPKTPNGKMSKETYLARITKQLRELRAKLKDVKPNTSTHRSLLKEIERLKESRTKAKSR